MPFIFTSASTALILFPFLSRFHSIGITHSTAYITLHLPAQPSSALILKLLCTSLIVKNGIIAFSCFLSSFARWPTIPRTPPIPGLRPPSTELLPGLHIGDQAMDIYNTHKCVRCTRNYVNKSTGLGLLKSHSPTVQTLWSREEERTWPISDDGGQM